MKKSRYAEAEGGEIKLEASECFFRYRVQLKAASNDALVLRLSGLFQWWNILFLE